MFHQLDPICGYAIESSRIIKGNGAKGELVYLGRCDIVDKPIITQIENEIMKFGELVRLLENA